MAELDEETLAFAHRMFDLARTGGTEELIGNVTLGLSPNLTNDKGDTLLILAAYHKHADTVAALVAHGADPNRVNDRGQSALSAAVFRQHPDIVKSLLAGGADPNGGTPSAVATAEFFKLPDIAALLHRTDS